MIGTNTIYYELECPTCGKVVRSGVGFRAGLIKQINYHVGEKIKWGSGEGSRPVERPPDGNLKTIGYFNCDNPRCDTWKDCFPEVQEAVITIANDEIMDVQVINYKPSEHTFDILEPPGLE